ncbi:MAG TPA: hypothetical protein VGU02_00280 [Gaiellaceae bacterium]|nr:hypothetical protein [Gaiellaceae bacterium]
MGRCLLACIALAAALFAGSDAVAGNVDCTSAGYAYAGIMGAGAVAGIEATLTSTTAPRVRTGHVAGWIGVGGPGAGPRGADEWLQAGLSSLLGGSVRLYYELATPGLRPRYVDLRRVAVGRSIRIGVLENAARPSWWRVWVNGRPASPPLHLVGSDRRLGPIATAESWRPRTAIATCNSFEYRFDRVRVVRQRGGSLSSFVAAWKLQHAPYTVASRGDGFVAATSIR